ncbi:MAG: hypothetical protein Q4G70_14330 [Pseudomonadota bacterium]|nr:hypothetical protein [Pseudomonadota bacterium]
MPPASTLAPLSSTDRHLLQRLAQAKRTEWLLTLALAPLLVLGVAFVFWIAKFEASESDQPWLVAFGLGLALFGALCVGTAWQRRRRQTTPLREALAHGQKQVTRGRLIALEVCAGNSLRYRLASQVLELSPILDQVSNQLPLLGTRLLAAQSLRDTDVELHWIALSSGLSVLLQAHYPAAPAAQRQMHGTNQQDTAPVLRQELRLGAVVAGVSLVVWLFEAWASGFDGGLMIFLAAGLILAIALWVLAFSLPRWLRARRSPVGLWLSGPVTEIITARVRLGRRWTDSVWHRIDGELWCPETGAAQALAEPVRLRALLPARLRHGYEVVLFESARDPAKAG